MSLESIRRARRTEYMKNQKQLWKNSVPRNVYGYDLDVLLSDTGQYANLPNLKKKEIKKFAKFADEKTPTFLILHGGVGLGKTALACSIVDKMFDNGAVTTASYVTCTKALLKMSYGEAQGQGTPEVVINEMISPDVLIIDDLGVGSDNLTPARKAGLWTVIDQRWGRHKATIITSNMPITGNITHQPSNGTSDKNSRYGSAPGMKEWLGDSTWDRISGDMYSIHFMGESIRNSFDSY